MKRAAFVDNRPEATAQRKLQALIERSPHVAVQRKLQAMIDGSPRMVAQRKRLARWLGCAAQAGPASARPRPPLQRKPAFETEEEGIARYNEVLKKDEVGEYYEAADAYLEEARREGWETREAYLSAYLSRFQTITNVPDLESSTSTSESLGESGGLLEETGPPIPDLPRRVTEPGGNHRIKKKLNVRTTVPISAALDSVLTADTNAINGYLEAGQGAEIASWSGTHWEFELPSGKVYMTHESGSRGGAQLIPLRGPGIASSDESGLPRKTFLDALNIARNFAKSGNFTVRKGKGKITRQQIQRVLSMLEPT